MKKNNQIDIKLTTKKGTADHIIQNTININLLIKERIIIQEEINKQIING